MSLSQYFDKIFCINLRRRKDRRKQAIQQSLDCNIMPLWFNAYDCEEMKEPGQQKDGNWACTASHSALLHIIAHHRWKRVLILEDDFECRFPDTNDRFSGMIDQVPEDWEMLYLGGSYGEAPKGRVAKHVLRTGCIMTTSSYAVTWQTARKMAPRIYGHGPIDTLYHDFNRSLKCYMLQPRLFVQGENYSDLQDRVMCNRTSMEDRGHEDLFPGGPPHENIGSHSPEWAKTH